MREVLPKNNSKTNRKISPQVLSEKSNFLTGIVYFFSFKKGIRRNQFSLYGHLISYPLSKEANAVKTSRTLKDLLTFKWQKKQYYSNVFLDIEKKLKTRLQRLGVINK